MHTFNPRTAAAALQIWQDCQTHGWEREIAEIARNVGISTQRARRVIEVKGWMSRVRKTRRDAGSAPTATLRMDEELMGICGDRLLHEMPLRF